jgi:cytochrome c peroxidase
LKSFIGRRLHGPKTRKVLQMTSCSSPSGCRTLAALASGLGAAFTLASLFGCSTTEQDQADEITPNVAALQQQLNLNPFDLRPLSKEPVPQPFVVEPIQPVVGTIINRAAAVRLGKALFWDIQAGSDGQQACAVCHASFGADARRFNTLNPGLDGIWDSGGVTGPGQTFTPTLITNDDVVGAQGVVRRQFVSFNPDPHIANEDCTPVDNIFGTERQVEGRQAPMIYGATFMRQLFWAGEAGDEFNGNTIWGLNINNTQSTFTHWGNSALASQAVGPPSNSIEMRCLGRPLNGPTGFAGKMLARQPLQFQRVSRTDSVLGALANPSGPGLICHGAPCTYPQLIAEAFDQTTVDHMVDEWTVIWGAAIQAYEMTLIPDQTPFDQFLSGRVTALTPKQILGFATFIGRGNCAVCHSGAMLSDATVSHFQNHGALNRDGGDQGFHNIGIADSDFDGGRGSSGPGGLVFSISGSQFDNFAFKTPTLRNVGLTAPYFHNGIKPTLEDVVEFYNNGGDVANPERSADIRPLHLTAIEKSALVDFMANALTDCRVEKQRAPFDHPALPVPNGVDKPAVGAEGVGRCPSFDRGHDRDDD